MFDVKVSIITVSYNSASTIRDTISSVASQTYPNIEYIVIDGGSKDHTLTILEDYDGVITKVISEDDHGIYDAMNKGISIATGDVIGILNSDDFFVSQDIISRVVEHFQFDYDQVDILLTSVDFVKSYDLDKPTRFYTAVNFKPWKLYLGIMPPHPGAFIRKRVYDNESLYEINYKICGDFDMFVRLLLKKNYNFVQYNFTTVRMRIGGISTSGFKSRLLSSREMVKVLKANGLFGNYFLVSLRFFYKLFQYISPR
jgi:glycosyltransferase involved in cell wall biosynthesis